MSVTAPPAVPSFNFYVPLSTCNWLRNFTFPDFLKFTLCQDVTADPLITILNPEIVPPDIFKWQEQITNPSTSGASQDVTATLFIANLDATDFISITRGGQVLTVVDVPGGVNILYGGAGLDMPPGFTDVGLWEIQFSSTAGPPGPQPATTTMIDGNGNNIGSASFPVVVPSTTLPFVFSITPNTGEPAGGTPVTIKCYNLNLAPSITAGTPPTVTVGGSPLTGVSINMATGEITGITSALLTGNADNWEVVVTPPSDPAFSTDNLWDWLIDQWFETAPLQRWQDIDPATDWIPGTF